MWRRRKRGDGRGGGRREKGRREKGEGKGEGKRREEEGFEKKSFDILTLTLI